MKLFRRSHPDPPPDEPWISPPPGDEWMPDTVTNLYREEAMTTEPHTESHPLVDDGLAPAERDEIERLANRPDCPECRGTGKVLTKNDLLRESIALLGDAGDDVVRVFYERLLDAAPELAQLFPGDLTVPASLVPPDSPGKLQRDKLLGALVAVSQTYDPERPEQMAILDTHLEAFGRSHAAFHRPDGSVRGATLDEYHAVKVVLFGTLHDAAGEAWLPVYDDIWSEAYDYAAGAMLFHGHRSGFKSARYARP
jgi:hemoglobin-like flavoprotein